ncbi:aldo/keto reductase [Listeria innocua]|uniref:aldo/keto reductase n=1 Tax=Listeria innocua TaxID=1642 RepID=UPI0035D7AFC6
MARKGELTDKATFEKNLQKVSKLQKVAVARNQTISQLAITWQLRDQGVSSVLIGASMISQLDENIQAIKNQHFSLEELEKIDTILSDK